MLQADAALRGQRGIGAPEFAAALLVVRTFEIGNWVKIGNLRLLCVRRKIAQPRLYGVVNYRREEEERRDSKKFKYREMSDACEADDVSQQARVVSQTG